MAVGTSACYGDVIDVKHVKKLAPQQYKNLLKVLKQEKMDIEEFAKDMEQNDIIPEKVLTAWNALCLEFEDKTVCIQKGLILNIGIHDKSEAGDKYDEVDGVYFTVDGMYELTPAGKKFNKIVQRKYWTNWG